MSTSTPGPRRRRIAGERKTARPVPVDEHVETPGAVAAPAAPAPDDGPLAEDRGTMPPAVGTTPRSPRKGRPAPRRLLTGLAVAATLLVLVAATLALLVDGAGWGDWRRVQEQDRVDNALRTAPAAAERAAETILSYDHRTLETDRDAAAALMTSDYRSQYLETFGLVMDAAPGQKAQVQADVRASGVSVPGDDRVEVLLFVNQVTVSTAHGGEPQTALNRVVFTMQRVGDAWRVDDITSY